MSWKSCGECGKRIRAHARSRPNPTCQQCRRRMEDERQRGERPRVCRDCGSEWYGSKPTAQCGSCRYARAKARAIADGRECLDCGKPATHGKYCTTHYTFRFRKQQDKLRNRFWISDEKRLAIYERDGWTCRLCNVAVRSRFEWTPDSPTLDHIVPRSLGGGHEETNLRTACWRCNSSRGARVDFDDVLVAG